MVKTENGSRVSLRGARDNMRRYLKYIKWAVGIECAFLLVLSLFLCAEKNGALPVLSNAFRSVREMDEEAGRASKEGEGAEKEEGKETGKGKEGEETEKKEAVKWAEFHVPEALLTAAYRLDVETWRSDVHLEWIKLLAYLAARHGGEFPEGTEEELRRTAEKLLARKATMEGLTAELAYYPYYLEVYSAILGGCVGEYRIQEKGEDGNVRWVTKYGLKAFSPIAKGFAYNDYDDFGASRSFGYKRAHLGHDMMGQIGTPIIAVESGYVEALGWNRYGGWRIGIRSFDKKRYYYYAHLRQNFPYQKALEEGSVVTAGDVIGYMGHTGYSDKENVNNIKTVHLHFGLQLIFDESQKEGDGEIWIDCYPLTKFLEQNRSETKKNPETKEWKRIYEMEDPEVERFKGKGSV